MSTVADLLRDPYRYVEGLVERAIAEEDETYERLRAAGYGGEEAAGMVLLGVRWVPDR